MTIHDRLNIWIKVLAIILSLPGIAYIGLGVGVWIGAIPVAPEYIVASTIFQCLLYGALWLAVVIPLYFLARSYVSLWQNRYLS